MKRHVCIVRQFFYDLQLRREAEELRDAGFEVDVICLQEQGHQNFEIDNGVNMYRIPLKKKRGSNIIRYLYDYFAFFFYAGIKLTGLHFKKRYVYIQVNTMPDFLVFCTLIPRILGAKVAVFMKEPTPELGETLYNRKWVTWLLKVAEKWALRYSNIAFTVTKELKNVYVSRGANPNKIYVVLNAPNKRHLLNIEGIENIKPDPNKFTIIYHGSIEERYGHDILLQAISIAKKEIPGLILKIIGTGEFLSTVLNMINELDLHENVEYLGFLPRDELSIELAKSDVGIVAQKESSYSNLVHTTKMYEYFIFKKPVIASRLQSVSSYFDDSALRFYESNDPNSLANAIIDLYRDKEKRNLLVTNSQKLNEVYCWDNQSKIYISAIINLLNIKGQANELQKIR